MAQVNRYAYELCMNDHVLKNRIYSYLTEPETVIHPVTGRKILVGSRVYQQLRQHGIL